MVAAERYGTGRSGAKSPCPAGNGKRNVRKRQVRHGCSRDDVPGSVFWCACALRRNSAAGSRKQKTQAGPPDRGNILPSESEVGFFSPEGMCSGRSALPRRRETRRNAREKRFRRGRRVDFRRKRGAVCGGFVYHGTKLFLQRSFGISEEGYVSPAGRLAEPDAPRVKGKRKVFRQSFPFHEDVFISFI
jgi:hypothetical protein